MAEGNGVCTRYMHVLKSLSVLPPAGPLTTFGFSAMRRTLRRIWVETALFFEKGKNCYFRTAFRATATLPSFHRNHVVEGLQAAFEKSHALHPLVYSRFAYSRQDKVTDAKASNKDRSRFLSSGHE